MFISKNLNTLNIYYRGSKSLNDTGLQKSSKVQKTLSKIQVNKQNLIMRNNALNAVTNEIY